MRLLSYFLLFWAITLVSSYQIQRNKENIKAIRKEFKAYKAKTNARITELEKKLAKFMQKGNQDTSNDNISNYGDYPSAPDCVFFFVFDCLSIKN
jgi:uncharacterized membrane protein